jgi:hemoglobin
MRTLWVCATAGGPFQYVGTKHGQTQMSLEKAHFDPHISPEEFNAVAQILAQTLDYYKVPETKKSQVLAAFVAHKGDFQISQDRQTSLNILKYIE